MSEDEKIAQLITIWLSSEDKPSNRSLLKKMLEQPCIGGIMFSKGTAPQLLSVNKFAQNESRIPLLISIDGEWGLNMRLKDVEAFPKNIALGAIRNDSLIYLYGKEVAKQCKMLGIHVNFAPILDVNNNPKNPIINVRSFGEDPKDVARKATLYAKGLEESGILSVGKHFPGHGDTSIDSHKALPTITHDRRKLNDVDFYPFAQFIHNGGSGIMIAHLNVPSLKTNGAPSSLSPFVIQNILKDSLKFKGLIFTDGLAMKGISDQPDMSIRALNAGNDILLAPTDPRKEFEKIKQGLKESKISWQTLEPKIKKVLAYKYALIIEPSSVKKYAGSYMLNSSYSAFLKEQLFQASITVIKNEGELLPLKKLDTKRTALVSIGSKGKGGKPLAAMIGKYDNITDFSIGSWGELKKLEQKLNQFDRIIFAIFSKKQIKENDQTLINILKKKKSALCFFTSPYAMLNFRGSTKYAKSIVHAYGYEDGAQKAVAQALYGGIPTSGMLPVSIGEFKKGSGINLKKIRLGYKQSEAYGISSERLGNEIEAIVQEGIRQKAFPGCQILIAKNSDIIFEKGFGSYTYSNGRPVDTKSVYDLASITKTTATLPLIMKLFEEKKIHLNDPISKYLPGILSDEKRDITIMNALYHESGLTPYIAFYKELIPPASYPEKLIDRKFSRNNSIQIGKHAWACPNFRWDKELISTTKDKSHPIEIAEGLYGSDRIKDIVLQQIDDSKLGRKHKYRYSDLNFILLKEVAEKISGKEFSATLRENFYDRLGASSLGFLPLKRLSKSLIVPSEKDFFLRKQTLIGYVNDESAALFGGISGNAGLFSNANDLAKLLQLYLNNGTYGGERFFKTKTVQFFTSSKSRNSRRGLGFDKPDLSRDHAPASPNTPITAFGHTGFTGTCFWVDPTNQLIYIFLSNRTYPSRANSKLAKMNIRERIQDVIYQLIDESRYSNFQ